MDTRHVAIAVNLAAAACLLMGGSTARAQQHRVRLTVSLSDSAALAAPVPHFMLMIYRSTGEPMAVMTNEHGIAETALPAGDYRVVSFQSYAWRGRRFSWSVPLSVHGDSTALDLTAVNAGSSSAPTAGWPPVPTFSTPSGRPEVLIPGASKRAVMDALVAATVGDGWSLRSTTEYQVIVSRKMNGLVDWLLYGSSYDPQPELRETFTIVETAGGVRIIGAVGIVRNPDSAFEHADDVSTGRAGQQLQVSLEQLRHSLVAPMSTAPSP